MLLDSYHAHNFLDRGLVPGEYGYHQLTGLRRAVKLLTDRDCDVDELLVGPITAQRMRGVQLLIVNLTSVDRPPWLVGEIHALTEYVRSGGGIIFITDHSNCYYHQYHLLPLWERLGLIPTFESVCENAPDCRLNPHGAGWIVVKRFSPHPVTQGVQYLAMQTGGRVVGPADCVVARTSDQAWADAGTTPLYAEGNIGLLGDMLYSTSEEAGAQGVVLAKSLGRGRIVVISDQNAMGDMLISYADNWRLWLNACQWAGQLNFQTANSIGTNNSSQPELQDASTADDRPSFDRLIAPEPDRNAHPNLPPESWQVECWEPFSSGRVHWGGNHPQQFYHLWCWLNRWTWASAHQQPSQPTVPGHQLAGRPLVMAVDVDLPDARLQQRLTQVLRQNGKAIILAGEDLSFSGRSTDHPTPAMEQWRNGLCNKLPQSFVATQSTGQQSTGQQSTGQQSAGQQSAGPAEIGLAGPTKTDHLFAPAQWHSQPIPHWQQSVGEATVIMIPDASNLRNASFDRPEQAPTVAQAKWLLQFYQWLFEQS